MYFSNKLITLNCNQFTGELLIIGGQTIEGYHEGRLILGGFSGVKNLFLTGQAYEEMERIQDELLNEGYGGHNEAAPYCLYGAFILSEQEKYYLLKGDLNLDNNLDLMDVIELKYLIKNNIELENLEKWYADINSDEFVNSFDLFEFIYKVLEN